MRPSLLKAIVLSWLYATCAAALIYVSVVRIALSPVPSSEAQHWAQAYLEALTAGTRAPEPPPSARAYLALNPIAVSVWHRGRLVARHVASGEFARAVIDAGSKFTVTEAVRAAPPGERLFSIELVRGYGPLVRFGGAFVERIAGGLGLAPLVDGVFAEIRGKGVHVTPLELRAARAYEPVYKIPSAGFSVGIPLPTVFALAAERLGVTPAELEKAGKLVRFRSATLGPNTYPSRERADENTLLDASAAGAAFLLRHQHADGHYTYAYDYTTDVELDRGYSFPRHAGTTYFLAQRACLAGDTAARDGALRALRWLEQHALLDCGRDGEQERLCVGAGPVVEIGSASLTLVAAAQLDACSDDPLLDRLILGLSAFIRSLQRSDGEMMHEYNRHEQRPYDIQRPFFSGEAAYALVKAYRALGRDEDVSALKRLLHYLTVERWNFFGDRYFYDSQHWTCLAVGEADPSLIERAAFDYCRRIAHWNRAFQFDAGQSPWDIEGGIGVGTFHLPRLTAVAARTEGFISTYEAGLRRGRDDRALHEQITRSTQLIVRHQFRPGPVQLMPAPARAHGGSPGSAAELFVQNDYVQHACSAMLRWALILRRERMLRDDADIGIAALR